MAGKMKEVIRNGLFPLQMRSHFGPPSLNHCSFPSVVESDKEEKPQRTVVPKEVTPALCSLMSSYGSVSGSESEPEGKVGEAPCCFAFGSCWPMQRTVPFRPLSCL